MMQATTELPTAQDARDMKSVEAEYSLPKNAEDAAEFTEMLDGPSSQPGQVARYDLVLQVEDGPEAITALNVSAFKAVFSARAKLEDLVTVMKPKIATISIRRGSSQIGAWHWREGALTWCWDS